MLETDLSGNPAEKYVFFNGERVARVDLPANTVEYYFSDHLNSTNIVTNATGGIVRESDYVPYGGEVLISGTNPNRYKFTGKERDPESLLDDFDARFYSSGFGRFMTPDWEAKPTDVPYANFGNPQSLNLYSYVQNNPTTVGDPDGHAGPETLVEDLVMREALEHPEVVDKALAGVERATAAAEGEAEGAIGAAVSRIFAGALGFYAAEMITPSTTVGGDREQGQVEEKEQEREPQTSSGGARQGSGNNGTIYVVPGSGTQSGKDYVGRHNQPDPAKTRKSKDGRDRTKAQVVDTYNAKNTQEGRVKEQNQIDTRGLKNLDNKRNEIQKSKKKKKS